MKSLPCRNCEYAPLPVIRTVFVLPDSVEDVLYQHPILSAFRSGERSKCRAAAVHHPEQKPTVQIRHSATLRSATPVNSRLRLDLTSEPEAVSKAPALDVNSPNDQSFSAMLKFSRCKQICVTTIFRAREPKPFLETS